MLSFNLSSHVSIGLHCTVHIPKKGLDAVIFRDEYVLKNNMTKQ